MKQWKAEKITLHSNFEARGSSVSRFARTAMASGACLCFPCVQVSGSIATHTQVC